MAKQIRSKNLIENKEKYGLIWFDLESISRPIDKLRVKAKTLCENQLTEIKTEQGRRNQGEEGKLSHRFWQDFKTFSLKRPWINA